MLLNDLRVIRIEFPEPYTSGGKDEPHNVFNTRAVVCCPSLIVTWSELREQAYLSTKNNSDISSENYILKFNVNYENLD